MKLLKKNVFCLNNYEERNTETQKGEEEDKSQKQKTKKRRDENLKFKRTSKNDDETLKFSSEQIKLSKEVLSNYWSRYVSINWQLYDKGLIHTLRREKMAAQLPSIRTLC